MKITKIVNIIRMSPDFLNKIGGSFGRKEYISELTPLRNNLRKKLVLTFEI